MYQYLSKKQENIVFKVMAHEILEHEFNHKTGIAKYTYIRQEGLVNVKKFKVIIEISRKGVINCLSSEEIK
jgi:hypothetical protein